MTREEIDKAADKLLADEDPEKLRRFMEAHPVEQTDDMSWARPIDNVPEIRVVRRESWEDGVKLEIGTEPFEKHAIEYVREFMGRLTGLQGFSDEELRLIKEQSLAYMNSPVALAEIWKFVDGYVALGGEHEHGDAFGSLIADMSADLADVQAHHLNYHHNLRLEVLAKALAFDAAIVFKPRFNGIPRQKFIEIPYSSPLSTLRRRMLAGLLSWLMGYGAMAKWLKSDSVSKWREAYLLAYKEIGGPDPDMQQICRPFPKKSIDELMKLIKEAYGIMFADGAFADTANKYWGVQK